MALTNLTNTIADTQVWVAGFVLQRPTSGVVGPTEPAVTVSNKIKQVITAPPFIWEWNRVYIPNAFLVVKGKSDYKVSIPNFGFLEEAVLINPTATGTTVPAKQLQVYKVLSQEVKENRPEGIATLLDDNNGNITFRLSPRPNQDYKVDLIIQKAPVLATALTDTWDPIPDKMAYLYEQAFLAHMQGIYNSQLYLAGMEFFFRQLVAAAEGLSDMDKAIFLEDQLRILATQQASTSATQQGKGARNG